MHSSPRALISVTFYYKRCTPCAVTGHRLPQTGGAHACHTKSCVTNLVWSILPASCHTSPSMARRMTCLPGCAKYCVRLLRTANSPRQFGGGTGEREVPVG